ncbi:hypothetical protein DV702_04405 [Sporosarcina sp. PTS2304]|uniref:hypothetical protein n=1 Tax=Sporosarcina sp. PTS2304 TaxID=2283194 RepID=UPI000E0CD14A|nr:hypothetical protein [Sporosarcina sp. PTS2304]AXH99041.1 hypothetical protein DV702_04405 [Sporosarcina sp. PTS2304]
MYSSYSRFVPLVVTVGQVVIFPYYIIWLKQVSLTFTLFAWFFAAFSFAAAFGYQLFQSKKDQKSSSIVFIYAGMGIVYLFSSRIHHTSDNLPYIVLLLQVCLGLLQGYFRAWHTMQEGYHVHAVHHYLIVGFAMIGFSFVKVISPSVFIALFGIILCVCGCIEWFVKRKYHTVV